jgi:hypothetical protein
MRLVGRELTGRGFDVRYPEREEARHLTLTSGTGTRSALSVMDSGVTQWECPGPEDREPDSRQITDMVTGLLTGHSPDHEDPGQAYSGEDLTLKGIVGIELRARGLHVELDVYADNEFLDVDAQIVVTSPPAGTDAQIRVSDDGAVRWNRRYTSPEYASITWEPDYLVTLRHEKIALDVAQKIAQATLMPAPGHRDRNATRS